MFSWLFFNKQRVNTEALNDTQTFLNKNSINRFGPFFSKGLVRENDQQVINMLSEISPINRKPYGWAITGASSTTFHLASPSTNYALLAINASGEMFGILKDESYKTSPTQFESRGNTGIPISASPTLNYYYYVFVAPRNVRSSTYSRIDKNGNIKYPKQINGYEIYVVENAAAINPSSIYPTTDAIYVGRIQYTGLTISAADINYDYRIYAGIYQQNVNINIDTSSPPATYTNGEDKSLADHINAIGDGTVTPTNPHGVAAEDINALSAPNLSSIGVFRNGLLLQTGEDLISATTVFQIRLYNATGNNYLKLSNNANARFIVRGKTYKIEDISGYTGVTGVKKTITVSHATGWYSVFLDVSTDTFTLDVSAVTTPDFYQADTDTNKIYFGYVYIVNADGTLNIQRNEADTSSDNVSITPFFTWGTLDSKHINKIINEEYSTHSKNLISYNYRNDELGSTNSVTVKDLIGTSTIFNIDKGINEDDNATIRITANATPYTGQIDFYTIPPAARGINAQPTRTRIYTVNFTYLGADDYDDIRIYTDGGTTPLYYLPLVSGGPHQFKFTMSTLPAMISFQMDTSNTDPHTSFQITNLQVVEGISFSDIQVDDVIYTNQIAFDKDISMVDDGTKTGTLESVETRIDKMNLDGILQLLPIANTTIKEVGTLGSAFANWATDVKNMEIWFVRGVLTKVEPIPNPYAWQNVFHYESNITITGYKPLYANFSRISSILNMTSAVPDMQSAVHIDYEDIYINTVSPTTLTLSMQYKAGSGTLWSAFKSQIYYNGFMILQKL